MTAKSRAPNILASGVAWPVRTLRLWMLVPTGRALFHSPTGGRVNTFGEGYRFRLPRSQLDVSVSLARFVRASGDTTDNRGVVPDIVVTSSAIDVGAGRDPVLERAKACPSVVR